MPMRLERRSATRSTTRMRRDGSSARPNAMLSRICGWGATEPRFADLLVTRTPMSANSLQRFNTLIVKKPFFCSMTRTEWCSAPSSESAACLRTCRSARYSMHCAKRAGGNLRSTSGFSREDRGSKTYCFSSTIRIRMLRACIGLASGRRSPPPGLSENGRVGTSHGPGI